MTLLTPATLRIVLAGLWLVILAVLLVLGAVHLARIRRARRREALDLRARPLVLRFALLEEDDPALAATLREASGAFGARIDERLLAVLETVRGQTRDRVAALLVERGHPPRLRRRARSWRVTVRAAALRRLGQLGLPEDRELVTRAVQDPAPVVRTVAVRALAAWPSADAVTAALSLLRGSGEVPSLVVITALIAQGRASTEALDALRAGLADPSAAVRAASARALGELTSVADAEQLGRLLRRDPSPSVRLAAATALERVARESSVPALLEGASSPWGPVRLHSLQALLALPCDVTADARAEISRRGDALLAPLLPADDTASGS